MKKIKKILLIIFILTLTNVSVFAESGFEAILNIPVALSINIPIGNHRVDFLGSSLKRNGNITADAGVSAQIGYLFDIGGKYDDIGISALAEIGYQYNVYSYNISISGTYDGVSIKDKLNSYIKSHSLVLGLLPKFNKGNFSVGLGFGVKLPMYITTSDEMFTIDFDNRTYSRYTAFNNYNINNMNSTFQYAVIPYVKITMDYSVYFTEKIAVNIGAYINYDYGLKSKYFDIRTDSIDIGLELGLRFAPKL